MLILSAKLKEQPVLSLRTGGRVALAKLPIINPNNMRVIGFYCVDNFSSDELILLSQDIREHIRQGFVINDHEVLSEPEDLVRHKELLEIQYDPIGKLVITDHRRKLGKVSDYAADGDSLYIQKLYVAPRMLKSLTGSQLSIDRTQILEVTDKQIVVKEATEKEENVVPATARANVA
jgi:sporulation protein YlmC with PRC-barrel domain